MRRPLFQIHNCPTQTSPFPWYKTDQTKNSCNSIQLSKENFPSSHTRKIQLVRRSMVTVPELVPSVATPPERFSWWPWESHPGCGWFRAARPRRCWRCPDRSSGALCAWCCPLAFANPVRDRLRQHRMRSRHRHHPRPRGWEHPGPPMTSRGSARDSTADLGHRDRPSRPMRTPCRLLQAPPPAANHPGNRSRPPYPQHRRTSPRARHRWARLPHPDRTNQSRIVRFRC